MSEKEFTSEFKVLNSGELVVCNEYQRPLNEAKIRLIIRDYDPQVVNPVKVSYRNGRYYVVDGQHTVAALERMNDGKPVDVQCKVFYGMSQSDEARLFVKQTGHSSGVPISFKLRALANDGDPDVTAMVKSCERCGFDVSWIPCATRGKICAAGALWTAWKSNGQEQFERVLTVIKSAWEGSPESLQGSIIGGIAFVYKHYASAIDDSRMAKKLAAVRPEAVVRDGKVFASGKRGVAQNVLRIYNAGRKSKIDDKKIRT